jgi:multimeric flavodoxin WrbA
MERHMTNPQTLFILGSSRGDGETALLARAVFRRLVVGHREDAEFVDLGGLNIGPYDYENAHRGDDFLPVAQKMVRAKTIVFASPVYWYSMSGQMKIFFDRLTDLTGPYKPVGKRLADKHMFAIATGGSDAAPDSFVRPFADTADYFEMIWGGLLYAPGAKPLSPAAKAEAAAFAARIAAADETVFA